MKSRESIILILEGVDYNDVISSKAEIIESILSSLENKSTEVKRYNVGEKGHVLNIVNLDNIDIPKLYLIHASNLTEFGYKNTVSSLIYRKGLLEIAENILIEERKIVEGIEKRKSRQF